MNPPFINWIWNVRGSLALATDQSSDEAFERLDSLFRQTGTSHERNEDTLTFQKKDSAAQDKMSVFDEGVLQIKRGPAGSVLHYHLTSRALLFCFLAPLLFLGIAQLTKTVSMFDQPSAEAAAKAAEAAKKRDAEKAKVPMNWIDKALGAPAPEKPKAKGDKEDKGKDKKPSPTAAYVFAAIFAALFFVGRVLEDRLIRGVFKKRLLEA